MIFSGTASVACIEGVTSTPRGHVDFEGFAMDGDEFRARQPFLSCVVMSGVWNQKSFLISHHREGDDVIHATVAQRRGLVFGIVVLRIHDEDIRALDELNELLVLVLGEERLYDLPLGRVKERAQARDGSLSGK